MKIRDRITLWITGAGLLAALLFSAVIAYEMMEQPFELLDSELETQAFALLAGLSPQNGLLVTPSDTAMFRSLSKLYWLKVFDQQRLIYASTMTQFVDLPLRKQKRRYTVNAVIPLDKTTLEQEENNGLTFRIRVFTIPYGGQEYLVQIAKPMEKLWEEIVDLLVAIAVGLVSFTLALILLGYFVAGKILQPIAEINSLAREISDKTLDKRIPLGENQDELHTLSSSLNQMFDRLQFSFQRQKEFLANASHELKTPIAMQRLFFDEAMQRDDLPETFKSKMTGQVGIVLRMNQLVKNLLDLSALEQNEAFNPETIDLTKLATSVFGEFDEIIQAAAIHLSLNMKDTIRLPADKEKIRRILINLIDNGIKYNLDQDGEIRFSLSRTDNKVQMEIYNRGQTIPKNELKLVFNQFYRVEKSRSTALGGSGLGLTIVKQIVKLHHGTIEIESESDPNSWVLVKILLPS